MKVFISKRKLVNEFAKELAYLQIRADWWHYASRAEDKERQNMSSKMLDDDVTKLHKHEITEYKMYETPDETQVMRKFTKESHEDTFLRNIYRNIETMVNSMRK